MSTAIVRALALALLGASVASCAEDILRDRVAHEYTCPDRGIEITPVRTNALGSSTWRVWACGHRAVYTCVQGRSGTTCVHDQWGGS